MRKALWIICLYVLASCTGVAKQLPGQDVRILRDEFGVPHIYADTVHDLYYGYGYAIAQDRLFQMEMARRATQGTVAEVLGKDYVDFDIDTRRIFSPASIREQLNSLQARDAEIFDGYAAGMNRWLAAIRQNPDELMPKQFLDLGFEPADWTPFDVAMIFIGTMNNRFGDFNTELENASILAALSNYHGTEQGRALFDLLNPRFTRVAPTTIPKRDWSIPGYDSLAAAATRVHDGSAMPSTTVTTSGMSNCYVLGKDKTSGANAILVNGPQFGWFNPSYVYSVGMHGAGIDVVGNTPFGYPVIMFGHNKTITWGSTFGASDIVDLFAEQLHPEDSSRYFYQGAHRAFERRTEVIEVRGAEDVTVELLRSVHGPVIRVDDEAGVAYAKKRAWDGRELENLLAWIYASWAKDWPEWRSHAANSSINVNMYFADVDGNVGYFHGGKFPRRVPGHDNRFPANGDGSMDWQGRQDIDRANPHILNPSSGFLANWNNKPGDGVMNPEFYFYSWSAADRVEFLNDALEARERFTPAQAWALIEDSSYADVLARYLLPHIDNAVRSSDDPDLRAANRVLQAWSLRSADDDGDGFYDEAGTALFRTFAGALIRHSLADDLGAMFDLFAATGYPTASAPTGAGTNLSSSLKAIVEALQGRGDYDMFNGEAPGVVVARALRDALSLLNVDSASVASARLPVARRPFSHKNFLGIPQAGESETLFAPIEQNRGTENNMTVMRPGAIEGWEVTPPGQSGFIAPDGSRSPHYADQFDMYQRFDRKRMWFYQADVEAHAVSEVVLVTDRR